MSRGQPCRSARAMEPMPPCWMAAAARAKSQSWGRSSANRTARRSVPGGRSPSEKPVQPRWTRRGRPRRPAAATWAARMARGSSSGWLLNASTNGPRAQNSRSASSGSQPDHAGSSKNQKPVCSRLARGWSWFRSGRLNQGLLPRMTWRANIQPGPNGGGGFATPNRSSTQVIMSLRMPCSLSRACSQTARSSSRAGCQNVYGFTERVSQGMPVAACASRPCTRIEVASSRSAPRHNSASSRTWSTSASGSMKRALGWATGSGWFQWSQAQALARASSGPRSMSVRATASRPARRAYACMAWLIARRTPWPRSASARPRAMKGRWSPRVPEV